MATLNSPGVSVQVIDESFYTPAAPGTTPLIIVASAQDKANSAGTGTATGTTAANAGKVFLVTSQKELADTFGTPAFKTDANNNPIHAGEQNEYGLQAAYSYLGVSNRAYVVRANIDLNAISATATEPAGPAVDGQFWFDTANSKFGIFQWNGAAGTTTAGQTFVNKVPTFLTGSQLNAGTPKASIGAIGDYALALNLGEYSLWYKKGRTDTNGGTWVQVGTPSWIASWPTVQGSTTPTGWSSGGGYQLTINGTAFAGHSTLTGLVEDINGTGTPDAGPVAGVTAAIVNGKLELYSTGVDIDLTGSSSALVSILGVEAASYSAPSLQISSHTQVPQFKRTDGAVVSSGFPTGSVWIKTTEPNLGARWRVKVYNAGSATWTEKSAPMFVNSTAALKSLDATGGGINLAQGALYVKYNQDEVVYQPLRPNSADFKIFARRKTGVTTVTTGTRTAALPSGVQSFALFETLVGSTTLHEVAVTTASLTGTTNSILADLDKVATAINSAGLTNVQASVNTTAVSLTITHKTGGDVYVAVSSGTLFDNLFVPYNPADTTTTANFYMSDVGAYDYTISLWSPYADITASETAPSTVAVDGQLWYNSMVDEVDILVHNGTTWVGYKSTNAPAELSGTDPNGPIVRATKPVTQSDGVTPLATGDLWIDTSDMENYPAISRWNNDTKKWVSIDTGDQTTENGILFADARWGVDGGDKTADTAPAGTLADLLTSDFLDFDAPDPALYPQGMLLWNLRRSGNNVKKFVHNYVNPNADNTRFNNDAMSNYYPHRWVTESGNQANGAGSFGRKAQRKVVIQSLQQLVNSNQNIRDEESRVFNLIACPGYPELIGEMIALNYDRGLTAFVVGDTPARLTADATSLNNWGKNVAGAVEDNDQGLVSSDEYFGVFYPWGYTSDNAGNNIVVPPSHMILRTIALNDQVSYPWFAPAGTRRGGITNATAVGYVTAEGEFQSVSLNTGQRDTLAESKINPITFITGTGLVNYGQYTRAKNASSLDRINVARLVIYLRRQFALLAKPYVFEPNDKITRDELKGAAESLLLELVGQRAIYDYIVVCDTSNNTPARIDRNELYLDVAIEPVKAVEFIYIPLRLKNTGEIAGLNK